jgi:hypothetical protein
MGGLAQQVRYGGQYQSGPGGEAGSSQRLGYDGIQHARTHAHQTDTHNKALVEDSRVWHWTRCLRCAEEAAASGAWLLCSHLALPGGKRHRGMRRPSQLRVMMARLRL